MKFTIRTKLLLGCIVLIALFSSLQYLMYEVTRDHTILHVGIIQLEKAKSAAIQLDNFFTSLENTDRSLAQYYRENATTNLNIVADASQHALGNSQYLNKMSFLTRSGKEVVKIDRLGRVSDNELSYEIPTKPFRAALAGNVAHSKVYYTDGTKTPHFDLYYPIRSNNAEVIGVIKSQVNLENLWEIVSHVAGSEHGVTYIVDEEGRLIAHPDPNFLKQRPDLSTRDVIRPLLSDKTASQTEGRFVYRNEKNSNVFAQAVRAPDSGWIVVFEEPEDEALSLVRYISTVLLVSYIGLFLLVIIAAVFFSVQITNPINELKNATEKLKQGALDTRTSIHSGDEIETLGDAFNTMATYLQTSFRQLELQKHRSDVAAQLLLKRDLDIRLINEELENEKTILVGERNKLSVVLSGIEDAVIAVDLHHNILIFNAAAERLTGWTVKEAISRKLSEVMQIFEQDEPVAVTEYAPIRVDGYEGIVARKDGVRLIGRNGKKADVNLIAGSITEGNLVGLGSILTLHDITKEKELEEMKLDFVSMAAHELRTPLTSMLGYLSVFMQESASKFTGEESLFLNRIRIAAQQLSGLVENLLSVSRIERNSLTLNLVATDWHDLVKQTTMQFMPRANEKHITVSLGEPEQQLSSVLVDPLRITEVLNNLIANAINYSPAGSYIKIWEEEKDGKIWTHIQDTGHGIPSDALPHLFTKFFRVSGKLEQGSKGTGLGLYISKSIVALHGGTISVTSTVGKGSIFSFSLPVASK